MLVIATSIACATFKLALVGLILGVAIVALLLQTRVRPLSGGSADGVIVISVPSFTTPNEAAIGDLLRRRLAKARLESISQNENTTVLSYNFQDASEPMLFALKQDLASSASGATYNIFFNRAGAL